MIAIRENLVLLRQERATRIDQVDARQVILFRHLLGAQVFFDRQRIVGAAFDRGVIGDDHALGAMNATDAGNYSSRRDIVVVDLMRGE